MFTLLSRKKGKQLREYSDITLYTKENLAVHSFIRDAIDTYEYWFIHITGDD